ncbi:MAG: sulfotransferase [Myxococcales bacterium]
MNSHALARTTASVGSYHYRPLPLALLNRWGEGLKRLGAGGDALQASALLSAARAQTGLSDFGDESFREALGVLLRSIEREANLHTVGKLITKARLTRSLTTRLLLQDAIKRHPEVFESELPAPIVIAGLQRTGTTMLHRLLASDTGLRSLRSYEAIAPMAPERSFFSRFHGHDARWLEAKLSERALLYMAPDFFAIHPVEADAPEEDVLLLDYSFLSTVPEATLHVPSYAHWLEQQDQTPAYRLLDLMLRWLSHRQGPKRWVLKTPHHLEHLDVLRKVFPDARVIQTHRDPSQTLASFCSMIWHSRGVFSDSVDPHEIGRHWSRKVSRMLERALEVRKRDGERGFVDVSYEDLIAAPLEALEKLYVKLGLELRAEARWAMTETLLRSPQHKYGRHQYQLEDFGLSNEQTLEMFAEYRKSLAVNAVFSGLASR